MVTTTRPPQRGGDTAFAPRLLEWYRTSGRGLLPWRVNVSPYRVWISEIMLQQTLVTTVIPYYERFLEQFPTVADLAAAQLDEVLHLWSGLGYYARARNLHRTAVEICQLYDGKFPADVALLQELPGIGRSTAGAICAIAFGLQTPILDGNVKRVLTRFFKISGWPGTSSVQKELWRLAAEQTPPVDCADYTQAIMDLGATLCTRRAPNCPECPLSADCQALAADCVSTLPTPRKARTLPVKRAWFVVIRNVNGDVLLQKRPPSGLWGGLWCLPQIDREKAAIATASRELEMTLEQCDTGIEQRHSFTHYHLDYTPVYAMVTRVGRVLDAETKWVDPKRPGVIGLPRPIDQILKKL